MRHGSLRGRCVAGVVKGLAVAVAMLALFSVQASSAAESIRYPGLPSDPPAGTGSYVGPRSTTISKVAASKQWIRPPQSPFVAWNFNQVHRIDNSCRRLGDFTRLSTYRALFYLVSNTPRAPERFGYIGPFTVRSLAFGAIPVEAEVLIAQPRDEDGFPIAYDMEQVWHTYCAGRGPNAGPGEVEDYFEPIAMEAPIEVTVTSLEVDGVAMGLSGRCEPREQTAMTLQSEPYYSLTPGLEPEDRPGVARYMTTKFFVMAGGGLLNATFDIAPFTGCTTTGGEDISALLTATVSGPGNEITMRSDGLQATGLACADDLNPPWCQMLPDLPLPQRGKN